MAKILLYFKEVYLILTYLRYFYILKGKKVIINDGILTT